VKTKWGVLGSGGIARRRTIPEGIAAAANAELVAVYDVSGEANRAVAAQFGARACDTEKALLETDCDIVYVATPAYLHCDQVVRAAEAGKHVLCEKPLGMTIEEGRRMMQACRRNRVKLGTGFMMRFHAQHREALRLIREGRLGTPTLGRAQLSCWYPPIEGAWRQDPGLGGGGSLMDMGGHCIDLLEMFLGRARRVCCFTDNLVHGYESEDTAAVLLEFESGAKGVVDALFNVPDASSKNRLELCGSRGSILAEGTIGQGQAGVMTAYLEDAGRLLEVAAGYDAAQARDPEDAGRLPAAGRAIEPVPVNMYRAEVKAFARAVLEDSDPPVSGEDGLWSQTVLTACYESAALGRAVDLS
jgi:predicted dehydrogenase